MKKILILAANPTDTSKLRLDEEVREIQAAHRKARNREEIEIFSEWAVRVDDLRRHILYHKPNIVHFCGHGAGDDGLLLENQYAQMQLVSSESLAGLFKLFEDVECVVLNACYSEVQAEAIYQHINCVIGMNYKIGDKAAIEFATGFYDALTNARNYQDSFEFGKNALDLESIPESQIPQIKIKDISKSLLDSDLIDSQSQERNQNHNTNINSGNYNENIQGNYIQGDYYESSSEKPFKPIKYIPKIGNPNFVGRTYELGKVHKELYQQENNRVAIFSVSGMGGVGKTELAIQYARKYYDNYSGGIGWFNVRDANLAAEIIQFIQLRMGLEVPQKDVQKNPLTLEQQVAWCWQNWQPPEGLVLVVLDDVTEYKDIKKLLPRTDNQRFKLLITTRQRRLDTNLVDISLDVLSEDEALLLLRGILGEDDSRIDRELETTKYLCQWLGYLPLGLELVGRYLVEDADLSIAEMLEELKEERLENEAINPESEDLENTEITARLGVQAAFNLTWEKLDSKTQEVGELLSLFNPNTIAWDYVESVSESLSWKKKDVRDAKKQLHGRNVIKKLEAEEASYQIHLLIREFLQTKLQALPLKNELKQAFSSSFIEIAKTIPYPATLEVINSVKNAIPHLAEVAENQLDAVSDKNLSSVFLGLGNFYEGQTLYALAEEWLYKCVKNLKSRFGENHLATVDSLSELSKIYYFQGKYDKAEPLIIQALELSKQLLGENHPETLGYLTNLARLYFDGKRYDKAEPLIIQALELKKRFLGENHLETATSLNELGRLRTEQGRYDEAEPLYIEALELYKQLLGENHPWTLTSLNNLASLYTGMGRYSEAEPLIKGYVESTKQVMGENHLSTAIGLHNLASLYSDMGRYDEAEPIYKQTLELKKQLLGENHLSTANSLRNLATLYWTMGRYDEAEPLFIQAVEIVERVLGESHPTTVKYRGDLEDFRGKQGEGGG
ncbi:MAG: tetratricopeptide repeat protein [Cyanobacteria bacterium P01_C01_bin.38]